MKRRVYYCKSWFRAKKRATVVWPKETARAAHEAKRLYTVLVDSVERPFCFIEVTEKFVGVGFLDDRIRERLTYQFQEVRPETLFLTMATYREFAGNTDTVASGTSYMFSRDGAVRIRREFFNPHRLETAKTSTDATANYAPWPAFGEYDDVIRVER